ncbi:hypothetical protein SLEP1_g14268 [Rubroshorea leprosula]|nr:hypothetical protein SLEP1_g14268 [Rubroshorea leprosula]
MNSMANQGKTIAATGFSPTFDKNESKNIMAEKNNISCYKKSGKAKQSSLFVKVNIDGTPIGRKVDLNSHGCKNIGSYVSQTHHKHGSKKVKCT